MSNSARQADSGRRMNISISDKVLKKLYIAYAMPGNGYAHYNRGVIRGSPLDFAKLDFLNLIAPHVLPSTIINAY